MKAIGQRIAEWVVERFGERALTSVEERVSRILEEAAELAQAEGLAVEVALRILVRTYSRPVGEPTAEAAGVGLTLAAYSFARGYDIEVLMLAELERVESVPRKVTLAKHRAKVVDGTSSVEG